MSEYTAADMRRAIMEGAELGAIAFNGAMPNQFRAQVEQKARDRYPDPPRTLPDPHDPTLEWRAKNGELEVCRLQADRSDIWSTFNECPMRSLFTPTPERVKLWYDLLTNPNK